MQLDWTTFILEVINFLVLVWLLRHFFYRPVLAVLDARQARVVEARTTAEGIRRDAEALKAQYENRLADWNAGREQDRRKLDQEMRQERARRLDELKHALDDEESKNRARRDAANATREAAITRQVQTEAYGAAARLLQRLASPALTWQIARIFREDLAALPDEQRATLQQAAKTLAEQETVEIAGAHPLEANELARLNDALAHAAGRPLATRFREAPELIGGLRVGVGQCQLDANLANELAFFRRAGGHD